MNFALVGSGFGGRLGLVPFIILTSAFNNNYVGVTRIAESSYFCLIIEVLPFLSPNWLSFLIFRLRIENILGSAF